MISSIQTTQSTSSSRSTFQQVLLGYDLPLPTGPGKIVDFLSRLGEKKPDVPHVLGYVTKEYIHLPSIVRDVWTKMSMALSLYRGKIRPQLEQVTAQIDAIKYVKTVYEAYGYKGDPKPKEILKEAKGFKEKLQNYLNKLADQPLKQFSNSLPDKGILNKGLPTLVFTGPTRTKIGGGIGGGYRKDVSKDMIKDAYYIDTLSAWTGEWMDGIRTVYKSDITSETITIPHGKVHSNRAGPFTVGKGNYINKIEGWTGKYVNRLKITSENDEPWQFGTKVSGDVGGGARPPWEKKSHNEFFVGWAASSGKYVNKIYALTVTFSPAKWNPFDS